jgi:DNA polymerase III epsilon subunit-like protein
VKLSDANLVGWDFEGCGRWPLQVGVANMRCQQIEPAFFSDLFAPEDLIVPIQSPAFRIDLRRLRGAPKLWELWPKLAAFWSASCFVSHNIGTERKYLGAFALHPAPGWLDTLKLARFAFPNLPRYDLGSLLRCFNLYDETAELARTFQGATAEEHEPVFDACGALLFLRYLNRLPGWEQATVEQLQRLKPEMYYAQRGLRST